MPAYRFGVRFLLFVLCAVALRTGTPLLAAPAQDDPTFQSYLAHVSRFPSPAVIDVDAGREFTCAVTAGGDVWCWGHNGSGQLGNGSDAHSDTPGRVTGLASGVRAVATGSGHACALTTQGGVQCWGDNFHGQLGDGTRERRPTPVDVVGLTSGVSAISAGGGFTCALMNTGSVKCWGYNWFGSLGDGTSERRLTPVDVVGLNSDVTEVHSGFLHTCVLTDTGSVFCWGGNEYGQLGNGVGGIDTFSTVPVAVNGLADGVTSLGVGADHTCAQVADGVRCWGYNWFGQLGDGAAGEGKYESTPVDVMGLAGDVQAVFTGGGQSCALTTTGDVQCWGYNALGQLGDGTLTDRHTPVDVIGLNRGVTKLAIGGAHACAITARGGLQCWGSKHAGQLGTGTGSVMTPHNTPVAVEGLGTDIRTAAGGSGHTCALTDGGGVQCWGFNQFGQLGNGSTESRSTPTPVTGLASGVRAIAAGNHHTCALTDEGGVQCWGYNVFGELGDGTRGDANNRMTPVDVVGLQSGVSAISSTGSHTCVLMEDGGVKCWGYNLSGQLGDGTRGDENSRVTPVDVVGLSSGVIAVSAGLNHTCALMTIQDEPGRVVQCWGSNVYGELGDGSDEDSPTPVQVTGLPDDIDTIVAGGGHTCALRPNGDLLCWGLNESGQLGDGTTQNRATPVAVTALDGAVAAVIGGGGHTCALTHVSGGTGGVQCWGSNTYGQLGDGTRMERATPFAVVGLDRGVGAIAAGGAHTCAVTDVEAGVGRVRCWGLNRLGQLGVNPGWLPADVLWP